MNQEYHITGKVIHELLSIPKDSSDKWSDEKFTSNQVIKAYKKGVEKGSKQLPQEFMKRFEQHLQRAFLITERLVTRIIKKRIPVYSIHLKAHSFNSFETAFIIDPNYYDSDDYMSLFSDTLNYEQSQSSEDIQVSFLYIPMRDDKVKSRLLSDDFRFTLELS